MNVVIKSTYDWLFHYNSYSQLWNMFHREDTVAYWNGEEMKHPHIKSGKLETLEHILNVTNGVEENVIDYLTKKNKV